MLIAVVFHLLAHTVIVWIKEKTFRQVHQSAICDFEMVIATTAASAKEYRVFAISKCHLRDKATTGHHNIRAFDESHQLS